jgi:hypothetical protein
MIAARALTFALLYGDRDQRPAGHEPGDRRDIRVAWPRVGRIPGARR